jgi:hypothetical protein
LVLVELGKRDGTFGVQGLRPASPVAAAYLLMMDSYY